MYSPFCLRRPLRLLTLSTKGNANESMTTKKAAPVAARRRKNQKIARGTRARARFRMSRDVSVAFVLLCQFNTAIT